ncbi:allophanate hydrolase [Bauldia sp.]|uniref:allophanate hydrolase n=1 Tax=Bauldia sp. TaxID=2575872 RepID=UPI0025C695C0|nr:allophanate hydrolase [Bauldia sp.]
MPISHDAEISRLLTDYRHGNKAVDTIEAAFVAIEEAEDPGIFISLVDREDALSAARELGGRIDPTKPLYGVPFAVKDNIDVAGMPTTAACPDYAYTPTASAPVVDRLIEAGAILIGKTNLDQFATGLVGTRTPYPVPRNALDPALVPGGSSSGSGTAVARGLVSFALGTDTAGSGRVPAALNNVVGLKPSCGALSTRGVVPACRSLDCVSVFAGTVADAWLAFSVAAGFDRADPYSRPIPVGRPTLPPSVRIGVPDDASRIFGSATAAAAFDAALSLFPRIGPAPRPVDLAPFFETAALLYEGAWVAERYQAIRDFVEASPDSIHPVTRRIIEGARSRSAADAFAGFYQLAELKRATADVWSHVDVLVVPSIPDVCTLADVEADPIGANSRLGTYASFVNLLDLCALAVPGPFRGDGRPAGVTLIAPAGRDGLLAAVGAAMHCAAEVRIGANGFRVPAVAPQPAEAPPASIEVAVVGAHLSGMSLNHELASRGGVFVRKTTTEQHYRLYALPGGPPPRPGLMRTNQVGSAIEIEVWALPRESFGDFVSGIPSPLGIGTVKLADGTAVKGFLCEPAAIDGARDISDFGGWRAYLDSLR